MKPFAEMMLQQMLFTPSRLRGLCSVAFTPRKVEQLRISIQCIADELIDQVIAAGHLDVVKTLPTHCPLSSLSN
jgi:cytochrome P450